MKKTLTNIALSAMFIAIGIVLPFFTGQIQQIGNMLLPMHIPVLLCGFICGWQYGATVGFILPLMRSALFTMPVMFPNAVSMAFELATYGFLAGFLFTHAKWKCMKSLYRCLIITMLGGRVVWGVVHAILLGMGDNAFTLTAFLTSAFLNAIPGIILQLVLIPAIMLVLDKTHLVPMKRKGVNENGEKCC
ncbi:MAG: ECF transporter S component [Clostridia bacterium]|nr:ECF transporter S component [Clostridia bacterium]